MLSREALMVADRARARGSILAGALFAVCACYGYLRWRAQGVTGLIQMRSGQVISRATDAALFERAHRFNAYSWMLALVMLAIVVAFFVRFTLRLRRMTADPAALY